MHGKCNWKCLKQNLKKAKCHAPGKLFAITIIMRAQEGKLFYNLKHKVSWASASHYVKGDTNSIVNTLSLMQQTEEIVFAKES